LVNILYPVENTIREVKDLSGIWSFKPDTCARGREEGWYRQIMKDTILMPVPSSYNDITQDAFLRDFIGDVWYQTEFYVPKSWRGKRIVIRFGSVTHYGTVWVNGEYVTEHKGGYLPFEADISSIVSFDRKNIVTVCVNNVLDYTTLPPGKIEEYSSPDYPEGFKRQIIQHDFFNYAGIHRPVTIYCTDKKFIDDITIVTDIENQNGIVEYNIIASDEGSVFIKIYDGEGNIVAKSEGPKGKLTIENAHFWNVGDGYLYTLEAALYDDNKICDIYEQKFGIRTVKVTHKQILINGKPVYLKGFGRHEDSYIRGKGLDSVINIKDANLMKWIGANSFRTSHYPYSEEIMDLADRDGVLVIDECTAVGFNFWGDGKPIFDKERISDEALSHHLHVMRELISRDKNRPSVIMWSVANEAATYEEESRPYFRKVIDLVRKLDPTRPVTIVEHTLAEKNVVADMVDVVGVNRYYSWYSEPGCTQTIGTRLNAELNRWYEKFGKPILLAEFGADTIPGYHSDPPQMFSEEYQVEVIKEYVKILDELDFVIGEHVWNFADFNTKQGITRVFGNKKGVFTRERAPKMVAHYLKERWSKI